MIESNVDEVLSGLGAVPEDLHAIVARTLGDVSLSLASADELLAGLSEGVTVAVVEQPPRIETPAPAAVSPVVVPETPAPEPPHLTAAKRRRAEFAAAMLDSTPPGPPVESLPPRADSDIENAPPSDLSQAFEGDTDLSEPPPRGPSGAPPAERRLEGEATAQAIVAAFDDPDFDPEMLRRRTTEDDAGITFDASPAAAMEIPPSSGLELGKPFRRGSRRPELDRLLDQPLDALDFERSEPVANPASGAVQSSDAPAAAPPEDADDDFEILVDDEILEIAEDEVELMDEDPPKH